MTHLQEKNKKRLFPLVFPFIWLSVLILLGGTCSIFYFQVFKLKRLPEAFPITGAAQAYWEITADKQALLGGESVNVDLWLTTSGEPLVAGTAVLTWKRNEFEDEVTVQKGIDSRIPAVFTSNFIGTREQQDPDHRWRIIVFGVPLGDTVPHFNNNEAVKLATIVFKAKTDNPPSGIRLSASEGDSVLTFCLASSNCYPEQPTNSVNQSLAGAGKTAVTFGQAAASPSPGSSPAASPSVAPSSSDGLVGDLNADGQVNSLDWAVMQSKFGQAATAAQGDLNADGQVNSLDWAVMREHFGQSGGI